MDVCRQCVETKLWIIRYMRSGKDDKQMMCTCVDNIQMTWTKMTWTMCVCVDNVETKFYMIGYIKSTRDDILMTSALSVRMEYIKDHCR